MVLDSSNCFKTLTNSRWCRHPSSSSRALRSRAESPRRRHAVRPALLRPRG
ncbi:unnamed protein product, partial [Vitis vinifera]|uniref:Uncharacterized protein n=1 Tax=Vitis vinifera TaxID=29760 RepID=D7UA35_VITVI